MKNILGLIILIALDNNIPMKPVEDIDWPKDVDWEKLDKDAAKLSIPEAEIFCNGEDVEADKISEKYGLKELSGILNDIFDGYMYKYFYCTDVTHEK